MGIWSLGEVTSPAARGGRYGNLVTWGGDQPPAARGGRYGNLVTWGGDQLCSQRVSLAMSTCPEGTWRQAARLALSPRRLDSKGR